MTKVASIFTVICMLLSSCHYNTCREQNCNNGFCLDDECACLDGFEGSDCETEQRGAFLGQFRVTETCGTTDLTYAITVSDESDIPTEIVIKNIGNYGFDVVAVISGSSISIDHDTGNGATVKGTGSFANEILTLNYTLTTTAGQTLQCNLNGSFL